MDETNVVDLLPLIAECVLRRAAEMRVYANRIEREFGGDLDFEDAEGLVRKLRACAANIESVGTLNAAPALIRYLNRIRAAKFSRGDSYVA
jgi:hypothetical protein